MKNSQIWIYVGIVVVYFLLIGIVIVILLLAPKYPSLSTNTHTWSNRHPPSTSSSSSGLDYSKDPPGIYKPPYEFDQSNHSPYEIPPENIVPHHPQQQQQLQMNDQGHKKPFIPSRRDPIYDIDPRSSRPDQLTIEEDKTQSRFG